MKLLHIISLLGLSCIDAVSEDKTVEDLRSFPHDPRSFPHFYEWIQDGEEISEIRQINHSILIICWTPDHTKGDFASYEISGIQGRHSEAHVKRFLAEFYTAEQLEENGEEPSNLIVVGTNWGSGIELREKLKELSKKHSFSVFYAYAGKMLLVDEPESRLSLIRKAHEKATQTERNAAGQPATTTDPK